jgi:hypothetical protein
MARQIIKQPNGKYCVFSTVVDSIVDYDMSVDELKKDRKNGDEETIDRIITKLENGEKPYYQFTMTFDEMLETIKSIYGEEESNEINKVCQIE